ncbi:MAG TPA: (deoxy)nucleoside triphosphate pyrophosphohydrolase [Marmoricola sp.]|nr:(deoxy)nucleoside triphosphate pyrophosphohydrolase [Marmoricola sp.]
MRQEVVGAAILRHGRVLAARRTTAPGGATRPDQRWEFPGGKVEPGESRDAALVREVTEELGCTVAVTGWLEQHADVGRTHRLFVATARLVEGEPVPRELEHDALLWLGPDELGIVDWLEPDRPFLADVRATMTGMATENRGVFFDADTAEVVRTLLVSDGYTARVVAERDAWAVVTDAPTMALDLLVDAYDGWLDDEQSEPGD